MHRILISFALLAVLLYPSFGEAGDILKVNTSIKPPFSTESETGFFDLLIKELGKRAGIQAELVRQPPERALISANEGLSDIELPRIAGMEKRYPHLVMVPEKVINYRFVAFSRHNESFKDWQALSGLRVGYLIGWKIFENNVPLSASVTKLKSPVQLMSMLAEARIDVALYESYAGHNIIQANKLSHIIECSPPMAVKPMYIYVHNTNAYLVPLLDKHLKEMKKDGTYQRIAEETLGTD